MTIFYKIKINLKKTIYINPSFEELFVKFQIKKIIFFIFSSSLLHLTFFVLKHQIHCLASTEVIRFITLFCTIFSALA